jgi:FixJ family two-component response regulator
VLRERPKTAIVVVSSRMPQDLEPFPRAAVFLEKPFDRDQLLKAITRAREARPHA